MPASPAEPFEITHVARAPLAVVWRAFTERDELMKWFGPKGMTMPTATVDFRPGGTFHYCLRMPGGGEMWGLWRFTEIVPMSRIAHLASFADAAGNVIDPPFPGWPRVMLGEFLFTDLGDGTTDVTVRSSAALESTDAERATFDSSHDSLRGGWGGTLEQLDAYLAGK